MELFYYKNWKDKRVKRIKELLGESWFESKNILELGAAHGDIGIDLMKLGANVSFSDYEEEFLTSIKNKLKFSVPLYKIDQNKKYNLNKKFDLVLHLGVLYHLENWKQDLQCALNHSNLLILETVIWADNSITEKSYENAPFELSHKYGRKSQKVIFPSKKGIEDFLKKLGYKFLDISNYELNTKYEFINYNTRIRNLYEWDLKTPPVYFFNKNNIEYITHYRKMWLIIK